MNHSRPRSYLLLNLAVVTFAASSGCISGEVNYGETLEADEALINDGEPVYLVEEFTQGATEVNVFIETDECPSDDHKVSPGVCGCGVDELDRDGDGSPDCVDACSDDPEKIASGTCGCGESDADSDADGVADCEDGCPADSEKTAEGECGCGHPDEDLDGDATLDCFDACPSNPYKVVPGECGCEAPDEDGDGDGTIDCVDMCPYDGQKMSPGLCGCGVADADSDLDSVADCLDECPQDAEKAAPGACGCGASDADLDGNGTPDCLDPPAAFVISPDFGTGVGQVELLQDAFVYIHAQLSVPVDLGDFDLASAEDVLVTVERAYGFDRSGSDSVSDGVELVNIELDDLPSEQVIAELTMEEFDAVELAPTPAEHQTLASVCDALRVSFAQTPVGPGIPASKAMQVSWRSHLSIAQKELIAEFQLLHAADFYCRASVQLEADSELGHRLSEPLQLLFTPNTRTDGEYAGTQDAYLADARKENLMLLVTSSGAGELAENLQHANAVVTPAPDITDVPAIKPYFYEINRAEIGNVFDEKCEYEVDPAGNTTVTNPTFGRRFIYAINTNHYWETHSDSQNADSWLYDPDYSITPYVWSQILHLGDFHGLIDYVPVIKDVRIKPVGASETAPAACEQLIFRDNPDPDSLAYVDAEGSCDLYSQLGLYDTCGFEVVVGNKYDPDNDFALTIINPNPQPVFVEGEDYGNVGYAYANIPVPLGGNPVDNGALLAIHKDFPTVLPSTDQWRSIGRAWAALKAAAPHHDWVDHIRGIAYGADLHGNCRGNSGAYVEFKKVKISIIPPRLEFQFYPFVFWCDGGALRKSEVEPGYYPVQPSDPLYEKCSVDGGTNFDACKYKDVASHLIYRVRTLSHEARHVIGKFHGKDWPFYGPCRGTGIAADALRSINACQQQWCPAFQPWIQSNVVSEIGYSQGWSNSKRHEGLCAEIAQGVGASVP